MVLQKRLDYGFNGYQVPPIPRAARSVRRRCSLKRKTDDKQMCAFDLLATVAGKLLLEDKSSGKNQPSVVEDSINKEEKNEDKPKEDQDCYERNFLFTDLVSEIPDSNLCPNEVSRPASGITTSDGSEPEQLVNDDCKLRLGIFNPTLNVDSSNFESEDESRKQIKMDRKSSVLVSSVDSVKFPFCKDHNTPCGSFPIKRDNVKLVDRDDDENSSEWVKPITRNNKAFRPSPRFGDRKIRKLIASKHCRIAPSMKDDENYNADTERGNYLNRNNGLKRQRSLRDIPFKKRRLYDYSSMSNSDEGSDGICSVPENGTNGGAPSSYPARPGVYYNIIIGGFGMWQRTVMEAVNAVLGGGLRVGVIFQGKKIRDDNKTLLQTGISHDNKVDTLGFTLEPNSVHAPRRSFPEDRPVQLLHDSPQPLARYPPAPFTRSAPDTQSDNPGSNINNNFIESDHDSAASPSNISLHKSIPQSKALVTVPTLRADALAVVPLRKSKRSESAQRRIRRPFTVAEVEALVQAVEKLGTGRWRDVKLRAFDSAKHRTYVDLKDKWKTLVHTARISPQQRRGEPVPQELLDRVLTAHAFWSQHQAKQHLKSHPETCLLL
ncbi:hypothetical protein RD792_010302 [Penstemon davidsonii]|uniref:Uncharacterized protein n=1 Tax=Penstemon davidsonii TaxID=160366 RepID=A0ABR0D1K3_9LAMI|nr:hypothetical protein RD792_010302 [Penstemon davidsonii]